MPILNALKSSEVPSAVQETFAQLNKKLGKVPNIYATMAHSPATLKGMLQLGQTLKEGELTLKDTEAVALVMAQQNDCDYCLAAHSLIGKSVGYSDDEVVAIRKGQPADKKIKALSDLVAEILRTQGRPAKKLVDAFFAAGYGKSALVELIALVAYNIFTNYFNHIIGTEIDFPRAKSL